MASDEIILTIEKFTGIDRSSDETLAPLESAYMAENMDTRDGNLAVCKGFVKYIPAPVPGEAAIARLMRVRHVDGTFDVYVAAGSTVYKWDAKAEPPAWAEIKTYDPAVTRGKWDYVDVRMAIDSTQKDVLIVANGEAAPIKIVDGVASDLGAKLPKVNYLTMHSNRLFAAGDPDNPAKLYYSKTYTYGDWANNAQNTGGGELVVGSDIADGIVAIREVNNGVMVAKSESLYRISGTDSTNFYNRKVNGRIDTVSHRGFVDYQDAGFLLMQAGLAVYDGYSVALSKDNAKIREIIETSDVTKSAGAATMGKLYFSLRLEDGRDAILEYDAINRTFMLRAGFSVTDLFVQDDRVYFIGADRYVYRLDEGRDYDGRPIDAYWETHAMDFGAKNATKGFTTLYFYADGETGAKLFVKASTERNSYETTRLVGAEGEPVFRRPRLKSYGRRIRLRFFNQAGKRWKIFSGIQAGVELDED